MTNDLVTIIGAHGKLPQTFLKFGSGNSKLAPNIFTFSLPAGYACPGANLCKSQAVKTKKGYRIKDGPKCQFRCFAAIDEALKPCVRLARWHNFNLLKGKSESEMLNLLQASLPQPNWKFLVRFHVSGDFFSQDYFDAWVKLAWLNPATIFYGYTKSIPFWIKRRFDLAPNFKLVASVGGKYDSLIQRYHLRTAQVVYSEQAAADLGLPIDHDDSHAYSGTGNFALLLHGTQPADTDAARAWSVLKKLGKPGYSNKRKGAGWRRIKVGGTTPAAVGA